MAIPVEIRMEWKVSLAQAANMIRALGFLLESTHARPGCASCALSLHLTDVLDVRYEESWRCEEDLRRELRSDRFTRLASLLEEAVERPSVSFLLPGGLRGLEYAEEVRLPKGDWN